MKKSNSKTKPKPNAFHTLADYLVQNDYQSDYIAPEDLIISELSGPYRELTSNQYKSINKSQLLEYEESHTCSCTPETGCDENCQNRILYMYVNNIYL